MNSAIAMMCLLRILCCWLVVVSCDTASDGDDEYAYTRFDRDAYLAARRGGTSNGRSGETSEGKGSDRVDIGAKHRLRGIGDSNRYSYDDPNTCTTHLAPSSIPNSGLGMYTTVPYETGKTFPFHEIGILLQERERHYTKPEQKLLTQYPWAGQQLTFGNHEVGYGESMVPGLGMLANSHLGLVNARHRPEFWRFRPDRDGTDSLAHPETLTMDDVGRGAYSWHGDDVFEMTVPIQAGEEFFVSYGDKWFVAREKLLGKVPGTSHFQEADDQLRSFAQNMVSEGGDNYAERNANYERLLKNASEKDARLRTALPDNLQDVPAAVELGTARFSARDSIRSVEWLEENGACIDNIVAGPSTIPQAGKGAFATRSISEGQRITTTPVITLEREELYLFDDMQRSKDGDGTKEPAGHQLLLNYCYGHPDSSLLYFPYSPSVNFINHGDESNARIAWSTMSYHKAEWLEESLDEMKKKLKTGLMFDIIATRAIRRGEEILLNYGRDWRAKWEQHIKEWASMREVDVNSGQPHLNLTERLGSPTTMELNEERNSIVRTVDEDPYPAHLMTRCYFEPPAEKCPPPTNCKTRWKLTFDLLQLHPCNILTRQHDWYTAEVIFGKEGKDERHVVEYVPRYAIRFVDRPYSRDQYASGVFRHSIGLPKEMIPEQWLDLASDVM